MAERKDTQRQDVRIARSRAAMREALLGLLEETALKDITGALVAARAGVGYATYFRHYHNVRELLMDTVVTLATDLAARIMPALIAAEPGGAATLLAEAVQARRGAFTALLNGAGDETRGILMRHIADQISHFPDLSPPWLPHRLALRFAIASTVELLDWWLREDPYRPADEVAAMLDRLVFAPLR